MRKSFILFAIVVFVFSGFPGNVFAWNDKLTHPDLVEHAVRKSCIGAFLEKYLNLPDGMETSIAGEWLLEWLKKGSFCEDAPVCRAVNHFHTPHRNRTESCRRMKI